MVLILFEANKVKVEASKIPLQLHEIRKGKCDVDLYKMVRSKFIQLFKY
jgi:hypothetical protein